MPEAVRAEVGYVNSEWKGRSEIPQIYSKETRHANTSPHEVEIADARPLQDRGQIELDRNGFVLVKHESTAGEFGDREEFGPAYGEEMAKLIGDLTGADKVFQFRAPTIRAANPKSFFGDGYALYFHTDYSDEFRREIQRDLFRDAKSPLLDDSDGWHFAWYNLWRPINGEVEQNPLTLIDASTLDPDDLVDYGLDPENKSVSRVPIHNPAQRLYYFPRMKNDEVLVFKQWDTRPGYANACPHTSFRDPRAPENARRRRSVEMRYLCAFAPES